MNDRCDLPLFRWADCREGLVLFPLARQVRAVKAMASKLLELGTQERADVYWRQCRRLYVAQAMERGASQEAAEQQWEGFWNAVDVELGMRAAQRRGAGR